MISEIRERTDRQTDGHTDYNTLYTSTGRGVISDSNASNIPTWLVKVPTDDAAVFNTELPHEPHLPQPHPACNSQQRPSHNLKTTETSSHLYYIYRATRKSGNHDHCENRDFGHVQ